MVEVSLFFLGLAQDEPSFGKVSQSSSFGSHCRCNQHGVGFGCSTVRKRKIRSQKDCLFKKGDGYLGIGVKDLANILPFPNSELRSAGDSSMASHRMRSLLWADMPPLQLWDRRQCIQLILLLRHPDLCEG